MVRADKPSISGGAGFRIKMPQTVEESQALLLRRIAAQDRHALGEFYDQTAGSLYSVAFRILGNAQDAEEVIQDVFVQIWTKASTFNPEIGQAFHWVLSMMRNRCIDRLRARQRRSKVLVDLGEDSNLDETTEAASKDARFTENEWAAIRSSVATLPKDQRLAIEMAFFAGLTHQEIAEQLNEPLGTVKARIRRGMLKLRENLQAYL